MSFPYHDRFWTETADFVAERLAPGESVLAPDIFWWRFERIARYRNTELRPNERYDWAVLHKGELGQIAPGVLAAMHADLRPVFANEVFVVWTRQPAPARVPAADPHLAAYFAMLERLPAARPGAERERPAFSDVLPDPGAIVQFGTLSPRALREAMDAFFRHGGYRYVTPRDKAFFDETDRCVRTLMPLGPEARILDLACGDGRVGALVPEGSCRALTGIDVSADALAIARARWAGRREFRFAAMDASRLAFADGSFDVVTLVEASEHVHEIERVLDEAARVLRPGGTFIATAANRDSLNQIVARKLGFPPFKTSYQHVREFTVDEFATLLRDRGLAVADCRGVMLYPYWGIPGIDEVVRRVTDDDDELVEILRDMGSRIDPRHAYGFAMRADKPA